MDSEILMSDSESEEPENISGEISNIPCSSELSEEEFNNDNHNQVWECKINFPQIFQLNFLIQLLKLTFLLPS